MEDFRPDDLTGLTGWFTGDSFDLESQTWLDQSGNQNHANVTKGTVSKVDTGAGQGNSIHSYLTGSKADGIRFPTEVMDKTSQYTLFHVTKYNGPKRGRIFDGIGSNWLSGFHGGKSGVAHHGAWTTPSNVDVHGTEWIVSTDQRNLYRSNGVLRGTRSNGSSAQLTINDGAYKTQPSDWAVAEVIVYDRALSESEYEEVETYLIDKYQLAKLPTPSQPPIETPSSPTKKSSESSTTWNPMDDGFWSMKNLAMWTYLVLLILVGGGVGAFFYFRSRSVPEVSSNA